MRAVLLKYWRALGVQQRPFPRFVESMSSSVATITAGELAGLLRSKKPGIAIVDVRDQDFAGGHIAGAINIPRDTFKYSIDEQVERLKNKDQVVFHCMMSQVRGPYCAELFAKRLEQVGVHPAPKVSILEGGFGNFARQFHDDKSLFEALDERYWGPNAVFNYD